MSGEIIEITTERGHKFVGYQQEDVLVMNPEFKLAQALPKGEVKGLAGRKKTPLVSPELVSLDVVVGRIILCEFYNRTLPFVGYAIASDARSVLLALGTHTTALAFPVYTQLMRQHPVVEQLTIPKEAVFLTEEKKTVFQVCAFEEYLLKAAYVLD